ncbi:MAG TPA: M15 family metallopeptidase [Bosea sp. (in: a-proteobacteria)]
MSYCTCTHCLARISLLLVSFALANSCYGQTPTTQANTVYALIPPYDEFGRDQISMFLAWNPDPVGNHQANLRSLAPVLARMVLDAQAATPDLRFVIGSGRRDRDQQRQAVAWGWSRTRSTPHRAGRAVDLWPLDPDGRVVFDRALQGRIAAAMKTAASSAGVQIRWGGHFRGYKHRDRSHFELASRPRERGRPINLGDSAADVAPQFTR